MASGKFVSYLRVSTDKQGKSGLGLEAQQKAITDYLNGGKWELIKEFVEVESGKKDNRQELIKALNHCQITGATLLIAKLDRLSRDLNFISNLMKSGIEFVICDMPFANRFTIHILASVAEYEAEMISKRTKTALQALKARGVKLGTPANLNIAAIAKGQPLGVEAIKANADDFATKILPMITELKEQGMSLNGIARELNARMILTARGQEGTWTAQSVKNVLSRV